MGLLLRCVLGLLCAAVGLTLAALALGWLHPPAQLHLRPAVLATLHRWPVVAAGAALLAAGLALLVSQVLEGLGALFSALAVIAALVAAAGIGYLIVR